MDKRIWKPLAMTLAVSAASVSQAYADVDIDNDGLIEISSLQQLDLMRYDLAGTSLNGDSTGCPATGCNGYELVADLDFDTNGNGVFDNGDEFWNSGQGWVPVGWELSYRQYPFTGIFEGNSHTISHLSIVDLEGKYVGLFSKTDGALIQNLTLTNPTITLSVGSENYAGAVSGRMTDSQIQNVDVIDVVLSGYGFSGSITSAYISDLPVNNVHASGQIEGTSNTGGLFSTLRGLSGPDSLQVSNVSFAGSVYAEDSPAGLSGALIDTYLDGCHVSGVIESSGHNTAGLAGYVSHSTIEGCHVDAVVEVREEPYGVSSYFTGGLFSELGSSTIRKSSFTGQISSVDRYVGGISGAVTGTVTIEDVSIIADISAEDCCTGGIFGAIYSRVSDPLASIDIDNVIIAGDIHSGSSQWEAGIFGASWVSDAEVESALSIGEVYWDTDLSGVFNSGVKSLDVGGEGKTTFELQCPTMPGDVNCDASMYAGWDEATWDFGTSSDYPVLR